MESANVDWGDALVEKEKKVEQEKENQERQLTQQVLFGGGGTRHAHNKSYLAEGDIDGIRS